MWPTKRVYIRERHTHKKLYITSSTINPVERNPEPHSGNRGNKEDPRPAAMVGMI